MKRQALIWIVLTVICTLVVVGAGQAERSTEVAQEISTQVTHQESAPPSETLEVTPGTPAAVPAQAAAYQLNWYSINSGGATNASSTNYRMGISVGQSVAGEAQSTNYNMGIGFWYGAGVGGTAPCLVAATGDVNVDASITAADIIFLVNYVFKGGAVPNPCEAAGDVTCDGSVTASDIIYMVNHVFKGGPVPCDVCTMIPGIWSCP